MRKLILLVNAILLFTSVDACDFCNCYLGLTPSYNKHSIGLRYKYSEQSHYFVNTDQRLQHEIDSSHNENSGTWSGLYTSLELYGQVVISPKIRAMVFVPFSMNTFTYNDNEVNENTIGDITVLVHGQIINTMNFDSNSVRHRIFVGGGIKLPTGKWEMEEDLNIPFSHQLMGGTGSTDILTSLQYIGSYHNFGWSLDMSYKVNFENPDEYKYGNTLNVNIFGFYKHTMGNNILVPYVKSSIETAGKDEFKNIDMTNSGGLLWWNGGGLEFHYGAIKFDLNVMIATTQNLEGVQPEWDFRSLGSITYNF